VTKIRLNQEQIVGRFFDVVRGRLRISYERLLRREIIKRTYINISLSNCVKNEDKVVI
jgi:hypothetical protein